MADNATGTQPASSLDQHRMEPVTNPADLPAPSMQPGSMPGLAGQFSTTEILWWNNGIWGESGYAIPNDGGKPATKNGVIHALHMFIGLELFEAMHQPDVKFSRPPNSEWLHRVAKMIRLGRKRMVDMSVGWNDERTGDARRNTTTVEQFVVFPVPFFGGRVRNLDARQWCGIMLNLLGEICQHPDNDLDGDVTDHFTSMVDEQLRRVEYIIATKYLGITREAARAPDFTLPAVINATNYHPDDLFTESEMIDERPPVRWWPTANDLSPIHGIPMAVAKAYAMRWPVAGDDFFGDEGSHETAFPGGATGPGAVQRPGTSGSTAAVSSIPAPGSRAAEAP